MAPEWSREQELALLNLVCYHKPIGKHKESSYRIIAKKLNELYPDIHATKPDVVQALEKYYDLEGIEALDKEDIQIDEAISLGIEVSKDDSISARIAKRFHNEGEEEEEGPATASREKSRTRSRSRSKRRLSAGEDGDGKLEEEGAKESEGKHVHIDEERNKEKTEGDSKVKGEDESSKEVTKEEGNITEEPKDLPKEEAQKVTNENEDGKTATAPRTRSRSRLVRDKGSSESEEQKESEKGPSPGIRTRTGSAVVSEESTPEPMVRRGRSRTPRSVEGKGPEKSNAASEEEKAERTEEGEEAEEALVSRLRSGPKLRNKLVEAAEETVKKEEIKPKEEIKSEEVGRKESRRTASVEPDDGPARRTRRHAKQSDDEDIKLDDSVLGRVRNKRKAVKAEESEQSTKVTRLLRKRSPAKEDPRDRSETPSKRRKVSSRSVSRVGKREDDKLGGEKKDQEEEDEEGEGQDEKEEKITAEGKEEENEEDEEIEEMDADDAEDAGESPGTSKRTTSKPGKRNLRASNARSTKSKAKAGTKTRAASKRTTRRR